MDPVRPIGQELPAVQPIWREREESRKQKSGQQKGKKQERPPEPLPEDDGRPHIDVTA
jgi:hypothetical protein